MSNLTEIDFAIGASKRLKMDSTKLPLLMSFIPNALSNLSRDVANDPFRRRWMLTDKTTVNNIVTNSGLDYYCDLAPLSSTYGLLLEYLEFGTVFYNYTLISTGVDTGTNEISFDDTSGLVNGDTATFTTTGVLPAPLTVGTLYYVTVDDVNNIFIYSDPNNPASIVNLTTTGSGTLTMWLQQAGTGDSRTAQWLGSPAQAELDPSLPCDYSYVWLVADKMYTNRTLGTFSFTVPYVPPTLADLPEMLENDLEDMMVNLATTAGFEQLSEAAK